MSVLSNGLNLPEHRLEVSLHAVSPAHERFPAAGTHPTNLRLEAAAPAEEVPRLALHDPIVHTDLAARDQHDPGQLGLLIGEGLGDDLLQEHDVRATMSAPVVSQ